MKSYKAIQNQNISNIKFYFQINSFFIFLPSNVKCTKSLNKHILKTFSKILNITLMSYLNPILPYFAARYVFTILQFSFDSFQMLFWNTDSTQPLHPTVFLTILDSSILPKYRFFQDLFHIIIFFFQRFKNFQNVFFIEELVSQKLIGSLFRHPFSCKTLYLNNTLKKER